MKLEFKPSYLFGITLGMIILGADFVLFLGKRLFWPLVILALTIAWIQFWIDYFNEIKRQKQIELQFLEFIRNLAESVKSGISIPKSITNISNKDYGALSPYVKKLKNQIEWGIPTNKAFVTFSLDTQNTIIKRSASIIIEAEQSGGDITDILTSVVESVINVKKMKEERKASVYGQIVQGYAVFYIFIAIMLVLQLWLFPKLIGLSGQLQGGLAGGLLGGTIGGAAESFSFDSIFFTLILVQGFFAGLMIGKFSEGTLKNGLFHSLIFMTSAALIITTLR